MKLPITILASFFLLVAFTSFHLKDNPINLLDKNLSQWGYTKATGIQKLMMVKYLKMLLVMIYYLLGIIKTKPTFFQLKKKMETRF